MHVISTFRDHSPHLLHFYLFICSWARQGRLRHLNFGILPFRQHSRHFSLCADANLFAF